MAIEQKRFHQARNNDKPEDQCHPETGEDSHYTCKDLIESH
jgi:hypothetical protein